MILIKLRLRGDTLIPSFQITKGQKNESRAESHVAAVPLCPGVLGYHHMVDARRGGGLIKPGPPDQISTKTLLTRLID